MQPNVLLISLLVALVVSAGRFALDSFLPSMPFIMDSLKVSFQDIELALSLYIFGFGISQIIYGPLSDRVGRKPILIIGFLLFILGGTICYNATNLLTLLMGRLIEGIGMGVGPSLKRAILADIFEGSSLTRAVALISNVLVISLIIAPVFGGYVQYYFTWRENFLFPVLYAFIVLALIIVFFTETNLNKSQSPFKVTIVLKEYLSHFRNKEFLGFALCSAIAFSAMIIYFQSSSYILIKLFKLSPHYYGWISMLVALSYLSGGFIVATYNHIYDNKNMMKAGFILMGLTSVLFIVLNIAFPSSIISYILPLLFYFVGTRMVIPCSIAGAMMLDKQLSGTASSLMGIIQMFFTTFLTFCYRYVNKESLFLFGLLLFFLAAGGIIVIHIFIEKNTLIDKLVKNKKRR